MPGGPVIDEEGLAVQSTGDELLGVGTSGRTMAYTDHSLKSFSPRGWQKKSEAPAKRPKLTILCELGVSHRIL